MTLTLTSRREAVMAGLAAAHDFLAEHPGLPLSASDQPLHVPVYDGTDEEDQAGVDLIAGILGVTAAWNEDQTHYSAKRDFGGGVTYSAWAITRAELDRYSEHMAKFREPAEVAA